MTIEREYDDAFWRAGIARKALTVIDEAIYSLRLQRKALEADVHVREHVFADFIVAHSADVREINLQRAADRQTQAEAGTVRRRCAQGCVGPVGNEDACIQCGVPYRE